MSPASLPVIPAQALVGVGSSERASSLSTSFPRTREARIERHAIRPLGSRVRGNDDWKVGLLRESVLQKPTLVSAQARIHAMAVLCEAVWIPACAGMTVILIVLVPEL